MEGGGEIGGINPFVIVDGFECGWKIGLGYGVIFVFTLINGPFDVILFIEVHSIAD